MLAWEMSADARRQVLC